MARRTCSTPLVTGCPTCSNTLSTWSAAEPGRGARSRRPTPPTAGLPFGGVDDSGKLTLTYIRRKTATTPSISYAVEFCDALASWVVNASATENVAPIDGTIERVTVTDSVTSPATRFGRVRVSIP